MDKLSSTVLLAVSWSLLQCDDIVYYYYYYIVQSCDRFTYIYQTMMVTFCKIYEKRI